MNISVQESFAESAQEDADGLDEEIEAQVDQPRNSNATPSVAGDVMEAPGASAVLPVLRWLPDHASN